MTRSIRMMVLLALAFGCAGAVFGEGERRVALVIGNGAYEAVPLRNPPNDAEDVAAALKESGFEVSLVLNTSLEALEKAVEEFSVKLRGADTGLFYYAGHGVQVDRSNYLIPVSPRIDDEASVKTRAVAVDWVIGKMEATGVRTALVFLDSCRDNPFPGAGRSGTRGLAVIATPRTQNSLIAYATSPGDTAQDGSGRNGLFSGAFVKQLLEPGLELNVMMRNVRSVVASVTGNKQQPRVDDGMKEPFYFNSLDAVAAKARAERDRIAAELVALEAQIAARDKAIASAKTAAERSSLEVEQQKQKALEAAKRMESENAKREAKRLETEAAARKAEEESRKTMSASEAAQMASLKAQADARRAEYEKLSRSDDTLPAFLKEIAALESALAEIAKRYAAAAMQAEADILKFYAGKGVELGKQKADPWESDAEFKARIAKEQRNLDSARDTEIVARKSTLAAEQAANEKDLRTQMKKAQRDLEMKTYTVKSQAVSVVYGTFDRDRKAWPVTVSSKDPNLPYVATLTHDISNKYDLKTAYAAVDAALKAGALVGEMDYGITQVPGSDRFVATVREVRVRDLATGDVVLRSTPNVGLYEVKVTEFGVLNLTSGSVILRDAPNQTLPAEYLRNSIATRLREAEDSTMVLQTRYVKAKEARNFFDRFRLGSFITGGASALAAGVFYFLGSAAMEDYRSATIADEAVSARQNASLYSTLFGISVVTAGLGLVTGGVVWMSAPDMDSIGRELDAKLQELAELRAEKDAAK